jgi:hypothetical protein
VYYILNGETLKNLVDLLNDLSMNKWYGELKIKMEDGKVVIGEKIDKIKFDNKQYIGYKRRT